MKKLLFILPALLIVLFSCGESEPVEELVVLDTYKQRLSYVLGAESAKEFTESKDLNYERLNKDLILKGFKNGLSDASTDDCMETLQELFGEYGQDFDTTFLDIGSECFGTLSASGIFAYMTKMEKMSEIDEELLFKGFEHGLFGKDTLITEADQRTIVEDFFTKIQEKETEKIAQMEVPWWVAVKSKPNTREIESGVYLETLIEGTGDSPTATDDVEAHYILTTVTGDTMESSYMANSPIKINLTYGMGSGIIPGWTIGFPGMKKGGKYRLYVPSNLAYGKGSLCFEVDLLSIAPQGTLVELKQQMPQGM